MFEQIKTTSESDGQDNNQKDLKKRLDDFNKNQRMKSRADILNMRRAVTPQASMEATLAKCDFSLSHLDDRPDRAVLVPRILEWNSLAPQPERLFEFLAAIESSDILQQHWGIIGLRRVLSIKQSLPIQQIIDHNAVVRILAMAQNEAQQHLQMEATWCLANMASGSTEQTRSLIHKNVINVFINLAKSKYSQVAEQAIWGLGNISGDCVEFRSKVLASSAVDVLIDVFDKIAKHHKIAEYIAWVFSNLLRLRPEKESLALGSSKMISRLIDMFVATKEPSTEEDCLYGISRYAKAPLIELFDKDEFLAKLIAFYEGLLKNVESNKAKISAINSIIGGMTSTTDIITLRVVSYGFLRLISIVLSSNDENLLRECCWSLSNVAIGSQEQVSKLLTEPGLMDKVVQLAFNSSPKISKEAVWIVCNLCLSKNQENLRFLLGQVKILSIFSAVLDNHEDTNKITLVLEALLQLLSFFDGFKDQNGKNSLTVDLVSCGMGKKIEMLQTHSSDAIYVKALNLLETFFELED